MNIEKIKNLLKQKQWEIRVIRKNYWPMIYPYNKNSYIEEIILVIQAFWFYNSLDFVIHDQELQDKIKALNHCKKFQKQTFTHIDNIIVEIKRYIQCVEQIFWNNIPNRIIRISSLYDIDVNQFNSIKEFVDFFIETICESYKFFWNKYKAVLENTNEMQVIENDIYPPLRFDKSINWNEIIIYKNHKLIYKVIPWYSPCGLMYMFWLDGNIDNYFFFISVYFYQKSAILSCIQYNFVNIGKNNNQEICLYDETEENIDILPLERKEENIFIKNLWNIFDDNPTKIFVKICIENLKNLQYKKIFIINPTENKWLIEHNQDRAKESILKSWKNLYTNIWLELWWKIITNWRVIL